MATTPGARKPRIGRQPVSISTPDDPLRARQGRSVARALAKLYPDATCALRHRNPFELLVATILSAQCTDKKVNEVTPELFRRWPTAGALAACPPAELEAVIRATGVFRAKAKSLIAMSNALVRDHDGEVPKSLDALTALAGVGRKTAQVVLGTWFGVATGIVVDTHVRRLSQRLGLTRANDPDKIDADLQAIIPKSHWIAFSHRMIEHGRKVCIAQRPKCSDCGLRKICPRIGVDKGAAAE